MIHGTIIWVLTFISPYTPHPLPTAYFQDSAFCFQEAGRLNVLYVGEKTFYCEQRIK